MANRTHLTKEEIALLQEEIKPLTSGFDFITDHVIITDSHANIIYANKGAIENTKYSYEELIGRNPADAWGGHMDKEFYEKMWHTIKIEKKPFTGEVKNIKKDGTEYWQELKIYPILGSYGEVKFFIGIEPDITIRKSAEEHQRDYLAEIERLNEFMVGREVKMVELKEEIDRLKLRLSEIEK